MLMYLMCIRSVEGLRPLVTSIGGSPEACDEGSALWISGAKLSDWDGMPFVGRVLLISWMRIRIPILLFLSGAKIFVPLFRHYKATWMFNYCISA